MNIVKTFFVSILLLVVASLCQGQYYVSGQNPPEVKWREIRTEHFQVIYPENCETIGQYTAARLEEIYHEVGRTLGHEPKKVSIVLQSNTTTSNGFVVWAPKRSEFFTTPPQDHEAINWIDLLAIHEFRHIVQIDKLNQGFTRLLYFLLGEQAIGGILGLTTPPWFLEGDATLTETLLSQGGRGRLASFETRVKTQLASLGRFSYAKAQFGSFKHFVPSHYHLGYYLTAYGRRKYGADIWDKTLNRVAKFPFVPFRFSTALKKETGVSSRKFYEQALNELDSLWGIDTIAYARLESINLRKNKVPLDYQLPTPLPNGKILAVKSGFGEINRLVQLGEGGEEELVYTFGPYRKNSLSTNGTHAVWSEVRYNIRYSYENYSVVQVLDLESQKVFEWKPQTKLFAPAISSDGKHVVAVEINNSAACGLKIFDVYDTSQIDELTPSVVGVLYRQPSWSEDGTSVYVIKQTEKGNSICQIDVESKEERVVLGPLYENINYPIEKGSRLLFHAAFNGVDNIYMLNLNSKELFQVTQSRHGAFQPMWTSSGDSVVFSEYSQDGFDIKSLAINESMMSLINARESSIPNYFEPLLIQESESLSLTDIPDTTFESKEYKEPLHWFNIHSWQPYSAVNLGNVDPNLGFAVLSQNKLSTVVTVLSGEFDYRQKTQSLELDMQFLRPELRFGLNFHDRRYFDQNTRLDDGELLDEVKVRGADINLSYPMNFTKSKYQLHAFWQGTVSFNNMQFNDPNKNQLYAELNVPVSTELSVIRRLSRSKRDILSRWEQGYTFYTWGVFLGDVNKGRPFFYNRLWANFPGVLKHHVAVVEYMNEASSGFAFQLARLPRGYRSVRRTNLDLLSFRYTAPLAYPDLNLSFLTYIQRLKTTVFAEYGRLNKTGSYFGLPSYGIELSADMNLLRYFTVFDIGVRYAFAQDLTNPHTFDLLFDVSF